jgi:hypothetical protein
MLFYSHAPTGSRSRAASSASAIRCGRTAR